MAASSNGQALLMTPEGGVASIGVLLPDAAALTDLQTFVGRAQQVDPAGAIRLVADGSVLAMYAGALHGAGAPTVLVLRVLTLSEPSDLDLTVPIAALIDRLPGERLSAERVPAERKRAGAPIRLPIPAINATGATWAGMLPARTGWTIEGVLRITDLRLAARAGIDEVAAGAPQGSGAAAVARLRALVWGRPLLGHQELPAGAAFAAEAFGFLGRSRSEGAGSDVDEVFDQNVDQDAASLHRAGRWWRLSTSRGHVLVRPATVLGS